MLADAARNNPPQHPTREQRFEFFDECLGLVHEARQSRPERGPVGELWRPERIAIRQRMLRVFLLADELNCARPAATNTT